MIGKRNRRFSGDLPAFSRYEALARIENYRKKDGEGVKKLHATKTVRYLYTVHALIGIALSGWFLFRWDMRRLGLALVALLCLIVPRLIAGIFRVDLPPALEGLAVVFLMLTGYLGEVGGFYEMIPVWDNLLHLTSGCMFCAFGCGLMNRPAEEREERPSGARLLFGVSFALAAGVIWEFIEFTCDKTFGTSMQKPTVLPGFYDTGLIDTMEDLALGFVGALLFALYTARFWGLTRGAPGKWIPTAKRRGESRATDPAADVAK